MPCSTSKVQLLGFESENKIRKTLGGHRFNNRKYWVKVCMKGRRIDAIFKIKIKIDVPGTYKINEKKQGRKVKLQHAEDMPLADLKNGKIVPEK